MPIASSVTASADRPAGRRPPVSPPAKRIIRIYDLGFHGRPCSETDKLFSALLLSPDYQKKMTTTELHWLLGRDIARIEDALGIKSPSLIATACRHGVPIFVGAVQDGSIFFPTS